MKVAVVGSGVMGLGITQAFAQSEGYEVNLCVVSGKGFDHKRALLEKPLKRQVVKEKDHAGAHGRNHGQDHHL